MGVDLYSMGGSLAQCHPGYWRRGWDQATALASDSVQITVCNSPKMLMQNILVGKKQRSNMARYTL